MELFIILRVERFQINFVEIFTVRKLAQPALDFGG